MISRAHIKVQLRCLHQKSPTELARNIQLYFKKVQEQKSEVKPKEPKKPDRKIQPKKAKCNVIDNLNDKYRSPLRDPIRQPIVAGVTHFFTTALVKLEWSTVKFLLIPGERERLEDEIALEAKDEDDLEEEGDPMEKNKGPRPKSVGLPEVMFLGKCNVGKSSLLNALLTSKDVKQNQEFAWASRRAGFTQTMNCFNVGNRFKLVDTPGYGVRGKPEQGKQVMEYLHRRKELRRVYLLIGAEEGFSQDDFTVIDMLIDSGVPFEVVFTKLDKLKKVNKVERHIEESGILDLPSEPMLIFTNSEVSKLQKERRGFETLRWSIFEACGLPPHTKPLKVN
jgi:ribosome biogenesis GTP-binding protein YsxC/EngB